MNTRIYKPFKASMAGMRGIDMKYCNGSGRDVISYTGENISAQLICDDCGLEGVRVKVTTRPLAPYDKPAVILDKWVPVFFHYMNQLDRRESADNTAQRIHDGLELMDRAYNYL